VVAFSNNDNFNNFRGNNMKREIHKNITREQWLELRKADVTSTGSAALFDCSPYLTKYELYQTKAKGIEIPFQENDRMHKGLRMEAFAAQEIALEHGVIVEPFNEYVRIPEIKAGASYDFRIIGLDENWKGEETELRQMFAQYGKGILEIKAVHGAIYKDKWENGEPPAHYSVQLDHQLAVHGGYKWGCIAAFTGVYEHNVVSRAYDKDKASKILTAIKRFWDDVEAGREPDPDYYRDGAVINALNPEAEGGIDFTESQEFDDLCQRYSILKDQIKADTKEADAIKAKLHHMIGSGAVGFGREYKFTAGYTKDNPGKLITEDMVGERIGERKGYRQALVKPLKRGK